MTKMMNIPYHSELSEPVINANKNLSSSFSNLFGMIFVPLWQGTIVYNTMKPDDFLAVTFLKKYPIDTARLLESMNVQWKPHNS